MAEEQPIQPVKRGRGRPRKNTIAPEEINKNISNNIEDLEAEMSMAESPEALLEAAKRLAEKQAFTAKTPVPETPISEKLPVPAPAPEKRVPAASAINPVPHQETAPAVTPEQHYAAPASVPEPRKLPAWAVRAPAASSTLNRFATSKPAPTRAPAENSPFPPRKPGFAKKPFQQRVPASNFTPNYTKLSYKDSLEIPTLKLGEKFDFNRLNDEEYLNKMSQRAAHTKKLIRRELPPATQNLNPNDPFARPEVAQIVEELIDDVPAEPIAFGEFYKLSPNKLIDYAQAMNVKNAKSLNRSYLILNILKEAYVARRPIVIEGTLDLLEYNGNGLLLYRCENYQRVEFSSFVPALLIKKYNLKRGHRVKGIAFPPMPGETAPLIVDILEVEGDVPAKIAEAPNFSTLTPIYPDKRIPLECNTISEKGNVAMRIIDLLCPIGYGQRMLINAPEGFDRAPLMHTITCALAKNAPDAEISVLLIDAHNEDIAEFRSGVENVAIVASNFSMPDETHIHIAELTIEHARRRAELGKHTIVIIDSLTRLARAYNNLRSNGQKFVSDTIDILTLVKPKRLFSSACNYTNGGSITIIASITNHSPNKAKEIIFDEFNGTSNAKITLIKKAEFPHIDIANTSNRRDTLLQSEAEQALAQRIRKNTAEMPAAEALEALLNDVRGSKTNAELIAK